MYVAANAFVGPLVQVAATMSLGSLALVARRDRHGRIASGADEDAALASLFAALGAAVACALVVGLWPVVAVLFPTHVGTIRNLGIVLALFLPLRFLNFAFSALLVARGGAARRLWIVAGTTALNVTLNLAFDGHLGAFGAAWATVLTEVGVTALFVLSLRAVRVGAPVAVIVATVGAASVWAAIALRGGSAPGALVAPIAGVMFVGGAACAVLSQRAMRPRFGTATPIAITAT